ncbi:MAG: hypothetical protein AAFW59_05525 [Pseudomonadota bacterium]
MPKRTVENKSLDPTVASIRDEYYELLPRAERLVVCVREQISQLAEAKKITLGVPLEFRVKTLASVTEKVLERRKANSVAELDDLIGARCIVLFRTDVEMMDTSIREIFDVDEFEDTSGRLRVDEFGYQSNHYIVRIPEAWTQIPSYADLSELRVEVQLRTLAQHIWAAGSHKLQYKHETNVPAPLRRSISRVSALLETVDLEFERFLAAREEYVSDMDKGNTASLNVDNLAPILEKVWPVENGSEEEEFSELVSELHLEMEITTVGELKAFLRKWKDAALNEEKRRVSTASFDDFDEEDYDRYDRGVFYTHTGLTRMAMEAAKGRLKS